MTLTVATTDHSPLADRIEYARTLSAASLIPRAFQNKPADVLVAVEYGNALGIAPIVALTEINVINGTPALSASLMAALAREAGHKVRVTGDEASATCIIVRHDDPDFEHAATWNEAKARAAGLWGRGHWVKDPATMLRWRAISECVRFACSEVLGGLKYSADEVADFVPAAQHAVEQTTPASPATPQPAAEPEPSGITREQSAALKTLMKAEGMDKAAMLTFARDITDRADLNTAADLTADEAAIVIAGLEATATPPDVDGDTGEIVDAEVVPDEQPAFDDAAWLAGAK